MAVLHLPHLGEPLPPACAPPRPVCVYRLLDSGGVPTRQHRYRRLGRHARQCLKRQLGPAVCARNNCRWRKIKGRDASWWPGRRRGGMAVAAAWPWHGLICPPPPDTKIYQKKEQEEEAEKNKTKKKKREIGNTRENEPDFPRPSR